jgi:hypothetical protein
MAEHSDRDFERLFALDAGHGPARAIDDTRTAAIIAGALGGAGFPPPMPGGGGAGSAGGAHGAKAAAHGAKAAASTTAKAITASKLTLLAGGAVTATLATVAWVALRAPAPAADPRRATPTSAVAIPATASPISDSPSPSAGNASPTADRRSPTADGRSPTADRPSPSTNASPTADRPSPTADGPSPSTNASPTADSRSPIADSASPATASASPTSGRPPERPPAKRPTRRHRSVVAAAPPNSASGGSASSGRRTESESGEPGGGPRQVTRVATAVPHEVDVGSASATPDDLLAEANAARAAHRWREADALYARVARGEPGRLAVQTALVASGSIRLEHLGDPGGAAQRFRAALAGGSRAALAEDARWGLAEAARATGEAAEERRALDEFLAHHAGSPRAPRARARRAELGPSP